MPSFSKNFRRPGCRTAEMASIRCRYDDTRVGLFEVYTPTVGIASAAVLAPKFCSDDLRRMLGTFFCRRPMV